MLFRFKGYCVAASISGQRMSKINLTKLCRTMSCGLRIHNTILSKLIHPFSSYPFQCSWTADISFLEANIEQKSNIEGTWPLCLFGEIAVCFIVFGEDM